MQKIKEKYSSELYLEVKKDMGLPTLPVPNKILSSSQHAGTSIHPAGNKHISSSQHNLLLGGITPSGLLAKVKQEKYHISKLGDPKNPYQPSTPSAATSPHGEKWKHRGDCTPPAKRFTNKEDLVSMLTPKSRQCSACQTLFSPPGKVTPAHADVPDNNLEVRSVN